MWYLLGAILWIIFAFWPAMVAKKKGYSFVLFFILSIFFFIFALILAYVLHDKTKTAEDIKNDKAVDKILEKEENAA